MASQEPKKQLTNKEIAQEFLRRFLKHPLLRDCSPFIGHHSFMIDERYEEWGTFSKNLKKIFRPELGGFLHLDVNLTEDRIAVSFSSFHHSVVHEIYKAIYSVRYELGTKYINGFHAGIGECEYKEDNPYIQGLVIHFPFYVNELKSFDKLEDSINSIITLLINTAEKRIKELNEVVNNEFNNDNLPEAFSFIEKWLKKGSLKHSKFEKKVKLERTLYYAHERDLAHNIRKIVIKDMVAWVVTVNIYYRGLFVFRMDYHQDYVYKALDIYTWLEKNASTLGIDMIYPEPPFYKNKYLRIVFTNITPSNYKERLESAFATIDKAINMF